MAVEFSIEKHIGMVGKKELCLVSWGDRKAKFDLREWYEDKGGETKPGKGITFSEQEAKDLKNVLSEYFAQNAD